MTLKNKTILITGGTGTFGKAFVKEALTHDPNKVIVYSRDEFKQNEMQKDIPDPDEKIRYFIGDIRDKERLHRAFNGVDIVIHAAALKQVPACEYNPSEALKTNAIGSMNVLNAAINCGVEKVVALSTDKAVAPVNLYGATKTVAEKIFIAGNCYSKNNQTKISVVRYGNVSGSRGSIRPLFLSMMGKGETELPLTHEEMTRFDIKLEQAIGLVMETLEAMQGGEIFVPKIPSFKVVDLIKSLGCSYRIIGIRQGEKLHETLISNDEAYKTYDVSDELGGCYIITDNPIVSASHKVPPDFSYSSDNNKEWLYK